jgi:diguanylate cyclase (GGDEF)-like protein
MQSYDFLKSVLDTITEHIVVIDSRGDILFVNNSWRVFGEKNSCVINEKWIGINYLKQCDSASNMGDDYGTQAAIGIRSVISGEEEQFYFEYPCHSQDDKRWFMMRVTPFTEKGVNCFVISHQNITERKLAEEEVLNLSRIDGLTDIPNRRYFNEFLQNEWNRCRRLNIPISLAMVDLDYFKLLNDTYGHQTGDDCLRALGTVLKKFGKRPNDLVARYGGEEFALIYGGVSLTQAKTLIAPLLEEVRLLNIPNKKSKILPILTASIGLSTMYPNKDNKESELIKHADDLLYTAKEKGRNQIMFANG